MKLIRLFRPNQDVSEFPEDTSEQEIELLIEQFFLESETKTYSTVQKHKRRILGVENRTRKGFERRLRKRWRKAFDSFDLFREYSLEIGQLIQADRLGDQELTEDPTHEALFRIHARACLIASEVRALIVAGHASGALTRWRSLHELAVIAFFLKENGSEVSERYMRHSTMRLAKHMRQYQTHAERLGFASYDPIEVEEIRNGAEALIAKYGKQFEKEYGWVSPILAGNVRFDQIEKSVGLEHWRPYFSLASESVHGGFRGMISDSGNMGSIRASQVMLAGPSNAGLADPGQCASISLANCTTCLVTHNPQPEYVVMMKVLNRLLDETIRNFIEVHEELDRDEAKFT